MTGSLAVCHRLMDDPREGRMREVHPRFLAHFATKAIIRPFSGFEQATGREPPAGGRLPADSDQHD
jgi:hypothetical protein